MLNISVIIKDLLLFGVQNATNGLEKAKKLRLDGKRRSEAKVNNINNICDF